MRTTITTLVALIGLATFTGCGKEELDVASMTTNPFDADYNGPAIFTLIDASTSVSVVNGLPSRRLNMRVQVHTEYFGRVTPYLVEAVIGGNTTLTQSNSIPGGVLQLRISDVEPGVNYCPQLYLLNGGERGGTSTVCATAE
jgi:hypothetical protein